MPDIKNIIMPFLAALWQGRWVALAIAWLVCLLGWIAVALLPNIYTASTRMLVDTDTLLSPLMKGLAVTPDFDRQVEIMRDTLLSVPNIKELIERTDLAVDLADSIEHAELIEDLRDDLYIRALRRNLYEIGYQNEDPDIAYEVVTVMLDIFVQQQLGHSQRDVEIAGAFIEEQIVSYDRKLRDAELRVAEFRREHGEELGGAERSQRDLERVETDVRRLRAELEAAHWRRDQLRAKLDSTAKTVPIAQIADSEPSLAEQQLRDLNDELTRKLLLYTERHPDVVSLRQLIEQANERVETENAGSQVAEARVRNPDYDDLNDQLEIVDISIDDLSRRLDTAEAEGAELEEKIRLVPKVEADLKRLNRDYDVLLNQYEELTQRRESAQLARELDEGKKRIEFRTIEPPVRPLQPSGPQHGVFMLIVLMLGLGAGCAAVIGRFIISDTVLTSAQLQSAFPTLPMLGGISELRPSGPARFFSLVGLAGNCAALFAVFATFFYFYQLSADKPDLVQLATSITDSVLSKRANAEP